MNYESQTAHGILHAQLVKPLTCRPPTGLLCPPSALFQGKCLVEGGVSDTLPLSHPEVVGPLAFFLLFWQEKLRSIFLPFLRQGVVDA